MRGCGGCGGCGGCAGFSGFSGMRLIGVWPERFRRSTRLKNLGVRPQIKDEADLQVRDVEVVIKSTPAAA